MLKYPYKNEIGTEETVKSDVLVLGGGMAGCFAAIAAARAGKSVALVEKGAVVRSGAAGSGIDHWESACTNPCSGVTPEEIAGAFVDEQDHFSNGIMHYIACREGWDRLVDLESFGAKIRDTDDEFKGAEFRDDKTKLMFAYDYKNKFTIRVWGTTFKPALYKGLKRLGVKVFDYTEATALLTREGPDGEKTGTGAMGMNVRTGKFMIFEARSTVLAMSRPARVWLFDSDLPGLSEFRPMQSIGSGHAMGYRAGLEFTLMEKSVEGEFSAAGRSFPPYSTGNNHNTWYAATMVDARGVELPYVDRDGRVLKTVSERYYPAPGQKFFLKGGVIDNPKYEYRGPETVDAETLVKQGYKLPFYADLSRMPDDERRVIFGMMVGEEGKTRVPVYEDLISRGFDPKKHMLQSYGTGWKSASFLPQERQLFGAPGGVMVDWNLETNIKGVYASGDQIYGSDCCGTAAATGYYAGRKAAASADSRKIQAADREAVEAEKKRLYAPLDNKEGGLDWRELNKAVSKAMQNYCGGIKNDDLLREGLDLLESYEKEYVPMLSAKNPHELMRIHEVLDIMDVAEMIIQACMFRKSSSTPLCFERSDFDAVDPDEDRCFITIRTENGRAVEGRVPLDYYGPLKEGYEAHNADYIADLAGDPEKYSAKYSSASEKSDDPVSPKSDAGSGVEISHAPSGLSGDFQVDITGSSANPLIYDESLCTGCGRCADVCQCDVLLKDPEKGRHPIVAYPGECYYCGSCVMECPVKGALKLQHPVMNRSKFVPVISKGVGSADRSGSPSDGERL